jgi:16S rRNA G1207 methylase RsmC
MPTVPTLLAFALAATLLIVANGFLRYGRKMERVFRTIETVVATRQYHVIRASDPR